VFVLDLADDLLHQILDRGEAIGATVFVDDASTGIEGGTNSTSRTSPCMSRGSSLPQRVSRSLMWIIPVTSSRVSRNTGSREWPAW
jgi:hypothetical protein